MPMQAVDGIFYVIILIMSVIIHEFAHGYVAYLLGDDTARLEGRLTLNPLKHLDPFGSVVLPLLLILMQAGFVVGWARPVPYNPNNLRNRKRGTLMVAFAGILANIFIAILFGLFIRFAPYFGLPPYTSNPLLMDPFYKIASIIVLLNLVLALFNLIPIPPLDGSKILFSFMPYKFRKIENFLERWGMFILLFFIIFLWSQVSPIIYGAFSLITGIH
ncbi:MAG: site-2 protease family protein [Patescibacteria group bacterium]|nr:site-2 protease family protein [Patescibacteria group bacterium]